MGSADSFKAAQTAPRVLHAKRAMLLNRKNT
jgi:hypothetical protein